MVSAQGGFDGIGFVFSPGDPFCGVDLDELNDDARRVIAWLASYTERSVSGRGAHVIIRAALPAGARHRAGAVEVYDRARFFVFTGDRLDGTPATIEPRQSQLERVLDEFLPTRRAQPRRSNPGLPGPVDSDDERLLVRAHTAANGAKFAAR